MFRDRHRWQGCLVGLAALAVGCSGDDDPTLPPPGLPTGVVPDFVALDVSPTSPSSGESVSPRDHLGSVSAWYFGHAT